MSVAGDAETVARFTEMVGKSGDDPEPAPAAFHSVHTGRTVVETVLGHRLDMGQLSHIPEDVIG